MRRLAKRHSCGKLYCILRHDASKVWGKESSVKSAVAVKGGAEIHIAFSQ